MSRFGCTCGYATDDDAELGDHLREVFTPDDDKDAAGQVHVEADPGYLHRAGTPPTTAHVCLCGHATDDTTEFDDHFLRVFTPADAIGTDGKKHVPAGTAAPRFPA